MYASRFNSIELQTQGSGDVSITTSSYNPIIITYIVAFVAVLLCDMLALVAFVVLMSSSTLFTSGSKVKDVLTISNEYVEKTEMKVRYDVNSNKENR